MQTKINAWLPLICALFFFYPQICPAQPLTLESAVTEALTNAPEIVESARKLNEIQTRLNAALDAAVSPSAPASPGADSDLAALRSELQAAQAALKEARTKVPGQVKSAYIDAYYCRLSIPNLTERIGYLETYLSQIEKAVRLGKTSKKTLTAVSQELSQLRGSRESAQAAGDAALDTLSLLTAREYTGQTSLSEAVFREDPRFEKQKQALLQAGKRLGSAEKMLDTARDDLKYGMISNERYNQFQKKKTDAMSEYLELQIQYSKALSGNSGNSGNSGDSGGSGKGGA
ncbi:MAG: hypothetical protein LBL26_10445 [Peptococcaceae bacterium]|jgi:outer membrane protein TolC|nr:hypothetical protein [Peptococcaceae bacterium]